MGIKYEIAKDVQKLAEEIVKVLNMQHIKLERVAFIRSYGTKTRAVARCYGLSKIWQKALGIKAYYIIEVIAEKFDKLSEEEKIKTIIHELLHIPKSFGGGLRGHDYANSKLVRKLYKEYVKRSKTQNFQN